MSICNFRGVNPMDFADKTEDNVAWEHDWETGYLVKEICGKDGKTKRIVQMGTSYWQKR